MNQGDPSHQPIDQGAVSSRATLENAVRLHRQGDLSAAESAYRAILVGDPGNTDVLNLLGVLAGQRGQPEEGVALLRRAVAMTPSNPEYQFNLGLMQDGLGRNQPALDAFRLAARHAPRDPQCVHGWARAAMKTGSYAEADQAYAALLALAPDLPDALAGRGRARQLIGDAAEAERAYRQCLEREPNQPLARFGLAVLLREQGDETGAERLLRANLAANPGDSGAVRELALLLANRGQQDEALEVIGRGLSANPDSATLLRTHGGMLCLNEDWLPAETSLRRALEREPGNLEALTQLAILLSRTNRADESLRIQEKLATEHPDVPLVWRNLAGARFDGNDIAAAGTALEKCLALEEQPAIRIELAILAPPIPESWEEIHDCRRRALQNLDALLDRPASNSEKLDCLRMSAFYMNYHGLDDRPVLDKIARAHLKLAPDLYWEAPHVGRASRVDGRERIKIGVLTEYLISDHSMFRSIAGLLERLDTRRFELVLLYGGRADRAAAERLDRAGIRAVRIPGELVRAREAIGRERLDILLYAEVGMSRLTYALTLSRLSPVQCVIPGHPITTGVPTMDYFLSVADYEPEDGDDHYSETLIRTAHPPLYGDPPPQPAAVSRRNIGVAEGAPLFVCGQTLFKIHPEFDRDVAAVLRRDRRARLVMFETKAFGDAVRRRLARRVPDIVDQIVWQPRISLPEFLGIVTAADAVLDSPHFNGGTTTLQSFMLGAPVVTRPTRFMRGRVTHGVYRWIGIDTLSADSSEAYADLSWRLVEDPKWRSEIQAALRGASGALCGRSEYVEELERFFEQAAAAR